MSQRAVPYFCPFCGDEDLRPHGAVHGQWECRACQRAFALKMIGLLNPNFVPADAAPGATPLPGGES